MPPIVPEKLYYFCHADQAAELCRTGKINWITPKQFDGITELNHESKLRFDKEQLTQSTVRIACSLIFGPEAPKGDSPLLNAIKRWRESERFATPDEAKVVLKELSSKLVEQRIRELSGNMAEWASLCSRFHILQLFEKLDAFDMWYKYANTFKGVAIAIKVGEDFTLEAPKPVKYLDILPEISTLKEQVSALLHEVKTRPEASLEKKFIQRALAFKSEKEWRCFHKVNDSNDPDNTNHDLPVSDISAIYLGPEISDEDKDSVLSAVHTMETKPKLFQSSFTKSKFDLSHDHII